MELFMTSSSCDSIAIPTMVRKTVVDLQVGDIIRFKKYNGEDAQGIFVARGFWDGRDQGNEQYYYAEVDGRFFEMNVLSPNFECKYLGHDFTYCPPDKEFIVEKLMSVLRAVPLKERIETFKNFQRNYPYLAYEYHPLVSNAWEEAIVRVTTMQEVIDNFDNFSCKATIPKEVAKYIKENIFVLSPECWFGELLKIRWVEHVGEGYHFIKSFRGHNSTYYAPLLVHLLPFANSSQELICLMRIWGDKGVSNGKGAIKQKFWIEDVEMKICG